MARRRVTHTQKDRNGAITALCNPDEWWSPRTVADVIIDIQTGQHTYHVITPDSRETPIQVATNRQNPYLTTAAPDVPSIDSIIDLPDC